MPAKRQEADLASWLKAGRDLDAFSRGFVADLLRQPLLGNVIADRLLGHADQHVSAPLDAREVMIRLNRDPDLRAQLVRSYMAGARDYSRMFAAAVRGLTKRGEVDPAYQVVDVLGIGVGIHEMLLTSELSRHAGLKYLGIERSSYIGRTFMLGGELIDVGTANQPGRGTLGQNFFSGADIQIHEIDRSVYCTPTTWAQVAAMDRTLSACRPDSPMPAIFEHTVVSVQRAPTGAPAPLTVIAVSSAGEELRFFAHKALLMTGLGESKFPPLDNLGELLRAPRGVGLCGIPEVAHYTDFLDALRRLRDPTEALKGLRLAVVGGGHAASSLLSRIARFGGRPAAIHWLGAGDEASFRQNTPPRYRNILDLFDEHLLVTSPGRVNGISRQDDGITLRQVNGTVSHVDAVVFCTGAESSVHSVVAGLFPDGPPTDNRSLLSDAFSEPLQAPVEGAAGECVTVARQLRGLPVYLAGTAAGPIATERTTGGEVTPFDLKAVGVLTNAFARWLSRAGQSASLPAFPDRESIRQRFLAQAAALPADGVLSVSNRDLIKISMRPFDLEYVVGRLAGAVRTVTMSQAAENVRLEVSRAGAGQARFEVRTPHADHQLTGKLCSLLDKDKAVEILVRALAVPGSTFERLTLLMRRGPEGDLQLVETPRWS